jgi:hypothetical protein
VVDALAAIRGGDEFRQLTEQIYDDQARIVAVSWGPTSNPHWSAGGLWMSFYAVTDKAVDDLLAGKPAAAARARGMLPPLPVDNDAALAWRPDGAQLEQFMLTGAEDQHGTLSWARLVFAAFQLAAQANLAETQQQATPRPERRPTERAGLPPRDVRIVRLRRSVAAAPTPNPTAPAANGDSGRWLVGLSELILKPDSYQVSAHLSWCGLC